jgi:S1-C subfamily serine protease
MSQILNDLSTTIANAVDRAADSVVQVYARRRPSAGVVFAPQLIAAPARALGDDTAVVRLPSGEMVEGQVLGHMLGFGLGVVRVAQLAAPAAEPAPEPRVGALAVAIGRTWSGAVMATVTNVAVIGGPLKTGRSTELARVIRIAQSPHGALSGGALADGDGRVIGLVTASEIRGTTVVIPATLAWDAAHQIVQRGGTRQGYLGIGTMPVRLPSRQRHGSMEHGLLIPAIAADSPADNAGLFVGDIIVAFAGQPVGDPDVLVTLLRGDHIGKPVVLTVMRGVQRHEIAVTIGERPPRGG